MNGYGTFAAFYDALTANIPYSEMALYFDEIISGIRGGAKEKGILLDLACGTGNLSEKFFSLGYDVIGVDVSVDMLSLAAQKTTQNNGGEGTGITYLCQDMRKLNLFGTVDAAVCALDSINHLLTPDDVKKSISLVSLFLNPGGVFIFDVNSEYKHNSVLAGNTFVYELDEIFCVWRNTEKSSNIIDIELDIFENTGNLYRRHTEKFSERAYGREQMASIIEKSGLNLVSVYDGDCFTEFYPPRSDSQRLVYVCVKK